MTDLNKEGLEASARLAWTWAHRARIENADNYGRQFACVRVIDHLTRHSNPNIRRLASDAARVVAETVSGQGDSAA